MAALTGNYIGAEGAKELASRVPQCIALQHLDLDSKACPMTYRSGVPIMSGLKKWGEREHSEATLTDTESS
eukprot:scaffold231341_cov17-Prasinocladus_malaysianus.AAC.1